MEMIAKNLTNDELANVIRTVKETGIHPSRYEKECLEEAAIRLEKLEKVEQWINETIKRMEDHLIGE